MNSALTKENSTKLVDIIPLFLFSFPSAHTRRAYLNDLKSFTKFLQKHNPNIFTLPQIDDFAIVAWKNELEKIQKIRTTSVRRKLNCISALFEFAKKRKYLDNNPVNLIKKPAAEQLQSTNALSQSEILKIFEIIEEKIKKNSKNLHQDKYANRKKQSLELEYAILHLLAGTGLRVSEVCQLTLGDLQIQHGLNKHISYVLNIKRAKGGSEHKVFLNAATAQILLEYKEKYRTLLPSNKPYFVRVQNHSTENSKPITSRAIYNMLIEHAKDAKIEKKISPHSIRAGVATILHSKGVPLARIQKQLGHANISTTSIYIKKANEIEESAALKLNLESD